MRLRMTCLISFAFTACSTGDDDACITFECLDFDAARSDGGVDSGARDAGMDSAIGDGGFDAFVPDLCSDSCGPVELCGDTEDGDGLDNDCDGAVDEDCACVYGTVRSCFAGTPELRGIGTCADGTMHCDEFGAWGACTGGAIPSPESCDGADEDCDGSVDDGLAGCESTFACPGTDRTIPLHAYALEGSVIFGGAASAWSWTVECPPDVATCPVPDDATARDSEIFFVASGSYRVRLVITAEGGETIECEWIVEVRGIGLRVELTWDTQGRGRGDTDVDLHLHRRSVPADVADGETDYFTPDDCFFLNCKASTYDYDEMSLRRRWALPDTPDLSVCRDAPEGEGYQWETLRGACYNPRLDVDVISCDPAQTDPRAGDFCAPENINIDNPPLGESYRVMVNYYSQHEYDGETYPEVNIYCNGEIRGAFGRDPLVVLRTGDALPRNNDNWIVADVMFYEDPCGEIDCYVSPISVIRNDALFGPPWTL
jgi:hypothetical protein